MIELKNVFFESAGSLRSWLKENHDKSPGIWMVYHKKHTKIKCIDYKEALREALCFGWIDSTVRTLDNDQYVRKFTPRKNTSNWSEVNKKLVHTLIGEGKMTEAGLKKIDVYLKTGTVDWPAPEPDAKTKESELTGYVMDELARNEPALTNFHHLSKTNKRTFIDWITSAKRQETIQKRLNEAISLLKENKKLGLK